MKKLTINRLALGNLKHRRKQYSIMLIGILLAMIFSSATLFFIFSLISTNNEMLNNMYGKERVMLVDIDQKIMDDLYKSDAFTEYGNSHFLGFAYTEDENVGSTVAWADDGFREVSYQSLLDGRYPENDGEIAAEKTALFLLGFEPEIGQTIKVNFKIQNGDGYLDKVIEKEYTVVGLLSDKKSNLARGNSYDAFYWKIPAIFVKDNTPVDAGGKERTLCYANLENRNDLYDREKTFNRVFLENGVEAINYWGRDIYPIDKSYDYQITGQFLQNAELTIVLSIILFIASGMVIINSFNNNLKERKKQIGMLRAVGATKKQIRRIFSREALIITLICLPLSLLISVFGVIGISKLIFGESITLVPEWRILGVSAVVSIITVMLATFVPLFSASRITPMQAIRDIESVRKLKNKKVRTQKQFKTENLLSKRYRMLHKGSTVAVVFILIITIVISCYGVSLVKAEYDNVYDYGYDYSFLNSGGEFFMEEAFDFVTTGLDENDRQQIESFPYIKSANGIKYGCANLIVDSYDDYFKILCQEHGSRVFNFNGGGTVYNENNPEEGTLLTKENWDSLTSNVHYTNVYQQIKNAYKFSGEYYPVILNAGNTENIKELENYVVDGKIDIDKLNSGEEIIIVAPRKIGLIVEQQKYGSEAIVEADERMKSFDRFIAEGTLPYKAGDKINIDVISVNETGNSFYGQGGSAYGDIDFSKFKRTTKEVTIGAIVNPNKLGDIRSNFLFSYNNIGIVTSVLGMEQFMPGKKYNKMYVRSSAEIDDEIDNQIMELLTPIAQKYSGEIWSVYNSNKETRGALKTGLMALAAIVILFTVIAASIVNNSIAASIREDKRKIGTLRAVGADAKVLASSYIKQLFSMFGWGVGLGFISIALVYLGAFLYRRLLPLWVHVVGELDDFKLKLYFLPTVIVCVVLFLICSVNLWLKVKKEMKNSIVENIREL